MRKTMPAESDAELRTLASLMIAIVDGLMLQWLVDRDAVPPGEEVAEVFVGAMAKVWSGLEK